MSKHNSIWYEGVPAPEFKKVPQGDKNADIVIVGAGITGITAAYLSAKAGKKVLVVEKGMVGGGDTGQTTAFLSYVADEDLSELSKTFNEKRAADVWRSLQTAIDAIESIVKTEKIDCEFTRCPLHFFPAQEKDIKQLKIEFEIARRNNFPVSWREKSAKLPFSAYFTADENAKFHPLKYIYALAKKVEGYGGMIMENTEVTGYDHVPSPKVQTKNGTIKANNIIIATHNLNNWAFEIHTRIIPYQTYVIAGTLAQNSFPEGLYIDSENPYHYLRVDKGQGRDRFLFGGEDHETGKPQPTEDKHAHLEKQLQKLLGESKFEVTNKWSGQVIETVDGLPFIGEYMFAPSHTVAGTGYAGDGMTFGTLAAIIATDNIMGRNNPWAKLYSTKRFKGVKEFAKQNTNFIKELFKGRTKIPKTDIEAVINDSGKVIESGGKKVAVYKDETGKVTKLSPVCTHLGCIVGWNDEAKTWDCPCHGSRFHKNGDVMNGPAKKPLKKIE